MIKLKNARHGGTRWYLLATASAIALTTASASEARAGSEPPVWIGFGWHAEHVYESADGFALPLSDLVPQQGLTAPLISGNALSHSYGDEGSISFRPHGSGFVFTLSAHYGRAHAAGKHIDQTTAVTEQAYYHTSIPEISRQSITHYPAHQQTRHVDADSLSAENHYIVDFEAGHDVGLGLFGKDGSSVVGLGVRYVQLHNALNVTQFHAVPDAQFQDFHFTRLTDVDVGDGTQTVTQYVRESMEIWHKFAGNPHSGHDFAGLGPSVYWNASVPLLGHAKEHGELLLDWGVNAALLFGRQKTKIEHQTHGAYHCYDIHLHCGPTHNYSYNYVAPYDNTGKTIRTRNVSVTNLGAFVGLTYRIEDVKFSAGYRGDYFIHAVDTGFTGQGAMTQAFYGPFASVSVGLGD